MDDITPMDYPNLSDQEGKNYKSISHLPISRFPPHVLHRLLEENSAMMATSAGQFGTFPDPPFIHYIRDHPLPQVHAKADFQPLKQMYYR